jgi:hypothetical protein
VFWGHKNLHLSLWYWPSFSLLSLVLFPLLNILTLGLTLPGVECWV